MDDQFHGFERIDFLTQYRKRYLHLEQEIFFAKQNFFVDRFFRYLKTFIFQKRNVV